MEAIFCYGLAICDSDWVIEDEEKLDFMTLIEILYDIKNDDSFKECMESLNVAIKEWTYEDCSQLLLAHKNLLLETESYEIVGKIEIEREEIEDLEKALDYLVSYVKEKTGVKVDFCVEPGCVLTVNY